MAKKRWSPRAGERELLDQLRVAAQQIDTEPGGRLGWILRFAREDPARWLPADREAHGYRLLAFGHPVFAAPPYAPFLVGGTNIRPLAPEEIMALHSELRDKFRALVSVPAGVAVDIPADGLETALVRTSAPGTRGQFGFGRGGPFRTMLFQAVAALVRDTDRLVACPTCQEPFLALRKTKFCTPKCTQRWHDREKVKAKQAMGGKR